MRNNLRQLGRHMLGYGIGMVVNRFAGIILFPIYTHILTPAEYGRWGILNSFSALLSIGLFFGLDTAFLRFFSEKAETEEQRKVTGTFYWTILLVLTVMLGLALLSAPWIARHALGSTDYIPYLRLVLLTMPFLIIYLMNLYIMRAHFALKRYNLLSIGGLLVGSSSSVLLAGGLGYGLNGLLIGVLIGYASIGLVGVWWSHKLIGPWHRPLLKPMLAMGLPLLPANLSYWLIGYVDRWFLNRAVSGEQLGFYEAANKLTILIGFFTMTFQQAWAPLSYTLEQREGGQRTYAKVLTYYSFGTLGAALALGLFGREILALATPTIYQGNPKIIAILAYAPVLYGAYLLLSTGANLAKKTAGVMLTMLAAALTNLALNYLLILRWQLGLFGAAVATASAFLVATTVIYFKAQPLYFIPYELGKILRALAIQIALVTIFLLVEGLGFWADLGLRLALLCAYLPLLWITGCFDQWEQRLAIKMLRHPQLLLQLLRARSQPPVAPK